MTARYYPNMPEHSCPYIDEIINWLDPEERLSELTTEEIIEYLEKIRSINQALRDDLEKALIENEQLKYKLLTYEVESGMKDEL